MTARLPGALRPPRLTRCTAIVFAMAMVGLSGCGDDGPSRPVTPSKDSPPSQAPIGLTQFAWGEHLFREHGCVACHSIHGARSIGGALDEIWGKNRELADGSEVTVDAAYVRESILHPDKRTVAGFEPSMPAYEDVVDGAELDALVSYIRALQ